MNGKHIPALDGVRGIAILLVMTFHFFAFGRMVPLASVDHAAMEIIGKGWVGVDLFFVLSGFLITGILLDAKGKTGFFTNFYARRALRIFPLYYAVLVCYFLLLPAAFPGSAKVAEMTTGAWWFWTYTANVQTAMFGWDATSNYLDHFWSLAVEEQFYLFWPLIVFALSRAALVRLCALLVVAALFVRMGLYVTGDPIAAYVLTPARVDTLAIGSALAVVTRSPAALERVVTFVRPALLVSTSILAGIWVMRGAGRGDPVMGTIGFTAVAVAMGAILLFVVSASPTTRLVRLLEISPLRSLGKYSYGMYVAHVPVALLLPALGVSASIVPPRFSSALPGQIAFTVIATATTIGIALLSWHLYEKHFLKLKSRFSGASVPAAAAPTGLRKVVDAGSSAPAVYARDSATSLQRG